MKTFASKIYEQFDFENTKNLITKLVTGEITIDHPDLANLTPLSTSIYTEEFYLKTSAAARVIKTTGHTVPKELKIARLRVKRYANLIIQLTAYHKAKKIIDDMVENKKLSTSTIVDIAKPFFPEDVSVVDTLPSLIYHGYGIDIKGTIVKTFPFPVTLDPKKTYWEQEATYKDLNQWIGALTIASGTAHLASLAKIDWYSLSEEFASQKVATTTYLSQLRSMARALDSMRLLLNYFKPKNKVEA